MHMDVNSFSKLLFGNQCDKEISQPAVSQSCNAVYSDKV